MNFISFQFSTLKGYGLLFFLEIHFGLHLHRSLLSINTTLKLIFYFASPCFCRYLTPLLLASFLSIYWLFNSCTNV
uniref:Uncharacterized protein n=1 Tax=Rhizophora mucronata TaxID=61149 RepID=A0A2P2L8V8_RHIMU